MADSSKTIIVGSFQMFIRIDEVCVVNNEIRSKKKETIVQDVSMFVIQGKSRFVAAKRN